jgi:hypothetical protein
VQGLRALRVAVDLENPALQQHVEAGIRPSAQGA